MAAFENNACSVFEELTKKLSCLVYARTNQDKIVLNRILDDLSVLNYDFQFINNNQKAVLVINQCCYLIPVNETSLVKKTLLLFQKLITKQNISVEGKTLSLAVVWCLDCLKERDIDLVTAALCVLQALIRGNGNNIEDLCERVISSCMVLIKLHRKEDPPTIANNALKCVEALTVSNEGDGNSEALTTRYLQVLFELLYGEPFVDNDVFLCKCYITAISALGNLADKWCAPVSDTLPELIGVVKGYMLYGLPGQENYKIEKVFPTNVALQEQLKTPSSVKKVKGKYDKKSKKKNISSIADVEKEIEETSEKTDGYVGFSESNTFQTTATTSDSDYSDGESGFKGKLRSIQSKVRHCALILLATLLQKGDSKVLTRYLASLLPDSSQVPHCRTLVTCLLKEPSAKCRSEVLIVLSLILSKFKPYLQMADNVSRSSFSAISNNIGNNLKELHRSVVLALLAENSPTVTTHILKTISDLIRSSPYHKLDKGVLLKLVKHVRSFINHKDVNVQISALTIFGCATSVSPPFEETRQIIYGEFSEENEPSLTGQPWLFRTCTKMLTSAGDGNVVLSVECLQVLGALVQNFFYDVVVCYPDDVFKIIDFGMQMKDYLIRLYTAKIVETMAVSLQTSLVCDVESKKTPLPLASKIWNTLIPGPVTTLIQSEDKSSLRSRGCECIASIGVLHNGSLDSVIFDEISRANQIMCITHLFGCCKDEAHPVRSTAIRALAVFIQFPSLRQDFLFFLDTVDTFFLAAKDENQNVRAQASWLFGNITEAAIENAGEGMDDVLDEAMLVRLMDVGTVLAKDTSKVKPHAVRGIGNLLKILTEEFIEKYRDKVTVGVETLLKNASTGNFMKARWNSCYALANALTNPPICSHARNKVFPVLSDLIQNYKNFKVRISAGFALSSLKHRNDYGEYYIPTWSSLYSALENAENITDFTEYQHRDQLLDQICLSMSHLISVITVQDLTPVQDLLIHNLEPLQRHIQRFKDRIVPEKGNVILTADARLGELLDDGAISREQKSALSVLCGIFLTDQQY